MTYRFKSPQRLMAGAFLVAVNSAGVEAKVLEEVMVTAQKTSASTQDTPIAITGMTGDALEKFGFQNANDISAQVPNMQVSGPYGDVQPIFSIRGVSMSDYSSNQASPIGVYTDEMYMGATYTHGMNFFDVERLEVLRGPQGTLYGKNTTGGALVLMYRWDAGEALRLIEREKVTGMSGVPVMARELINHPDFDRTDTSSLLVLGGGGAQVPPDLVQSIEAKVTTARPNTGYGMTETCGIITSVAADFYVDRPDSVGPAMPNFEVKCVNDLDETVPPGDVGELWVRGSSVIKGYINRPEATADSIQDGWLRTGDVARIDEDGFIYIVDRKKDMVLRGGENIYCAEVEAVLYRHDAIAECCVFGVPDARLGEEVAAAIVLKPGKTLSEDALREHCAAIMAKHKAPRHVWFLDQPLPRNASGKFLKRDLRDQLAPKVRLAG